MSEALKLEEVSFAPTSEASQVVRASRLKLLLIGLGFALTGIFIALCVVELLVRLFMNHSPVEWNDRPRSYFMPQVAQTMQDYLYPAKAPGTLRIAVVGDSFTFAPYMQFDDAFPKRLERFLNLNSEQPKVEVINYGVPRYSTSHEAVITKKAIEQGADLVLLQITLNDPEIKPYWPRDLVVDQKTGEVQLDSWIFRHWKSLAYVVRRIKNTQSRTEYKDYFFGLFRGKGTWANFKDSLRKLIGEGRQKSVPVIAVVFPLFGYEVNDDYPFFPIHKQIAELLDEFQVQHFDVSESFRNIPLERLQVLPGKDRHPNEIAHRMAAEAILGWLATTQLLPQSVFPKSAFSERIGISDPNALSDQGKAVDQSKTVDQSKAAESK